MCLFRATRNAHIYHFGPDEVNRMGEAIGLIFGGCVLAAAVCVPVHDVIRNGGTRQNQLNGIAAVKRKAMFIVPDMK